MEKMKANVFHGKDDIRVEEVELPRAGIGEAVIHITLTTSFRVSAFIPASCRFLTRHSPQALVISASSRRSALAARNGCAD
ncbi:MAG TPA: hypothetical protein VGC60_17000 [Pyrinomonadaceae bacterium]